MLLEELTYEGVEQYLKDKDTVLVPVGSVEQHSPYGVLGTDFITAEGVARKVGEEMGMVVAPTIHYGVSPHHMQFAGSVTLSPMTFIAVITDICRSFIHHGFTRIFFINGHGGNIHGLQTAFQQLKMEGVSGQFAAMAWYEGLKESELVDRLFSGQNGSHATPSEISLTLLFRSLDHHSLGAEPKEVETEGYVWPMTAEEMSRRFPDGRMQSAPWLASVDKGRLLLAEACEQLVERIEKLRELPLP